MIQIICCVCQKDMGSKDGQGKSGISHGYCPECLADQIKQIESVTVEPKRSRELVTGLICKSLFS